MSVKVDKRLFRSRFCQFRTKDPTLSVRRRERRVSPVRLFKSLGKV